MIRTSIILVACLTAATPAFSQTRARSAGQDAQSSFDDEQQQQQQQNLQQRPLQTTPSLPGRTANSSVGQVGQRQTRGQNALAISPIERIPSRIQNRVQSRIRNRIDPNYDPTANANSPFAVAEEQNRSSGRRKP